MDNTRRLTIQKNDVYTTGNGDKVYFKFSEHNKTIRDVHVKLEKNSVATLKELAKICEIKGISKFKKAELVSAVKKCVDFENGVVAPSSPKTGQTKKLRPCKYGERDVHGKCPKKMKTMKNENKHSSPKMSSPKMLSPKMSSPKQLSPKKSSHLTANFHNLTDHVSNVSSYKEIQLYVLENKSKLNIQPGDILFFGSTYKKYKYRSFEIADNGTGSKIDQYNFVIVGNDFTIYMHKDALLLPIKFHKALPKNIHYQSLVEGMLARSDDINHYFFAEEKFPFSVTGRRSTDEEIVENVKKYYKNYGIW